MTRDEAEKMCARFQAALHAMRLYSTPMGGAVSEWSGEWSSGVDEAQAAEDAIITALTAAPEKAKVDTDPKDGE